MPGVGALWWGGVAAGGGVTDGRVGRGIQDRNEGHIWRCYGKVGWILTFFGTISSRLFGRNRDQFLRFFL